jgi:hypothetical protein
MSVSSCDSDTRLNIIIVISCETLQTALKTEVYEECSAWCTKLVYSK